MTDAVPDGLLDDASAGRRRRAHERRVDGWIEPYLARRSRGIAHPVEDFLFTYYGASPAALRRWQPGPGLAVGGAEGAGLAASGAGFVLRDGVAVLDRGALERRAQRVRWIHRLLSSSAAARPVLSCFGLHEWAMVYGVADARRHTAHPLRLGPAGTDRVVEAHELACTHHDALRFFSPDALPRNAVRPTRESQHLHDQPGCLHVGMDLYKWAFQLAPLVSAELVADCFALARDIRELDMRASPYDLTGLGYEPVCIETPSGKAEYVAAQRQFARRSEPLRTALLSAAAPMAGEV